MYSASVFMLPTVFNELLMGINVRILNEILSLVEIKKKKQFADGALFYMGLSRRSQYMWETSFCSTIANAFLMKYLSDKLREKVNTDGENESKQQPTRDEKMRRSSSSAVVQT